MEKPEPDFRRLLDRYLKGTATPAEREVLERFFQSYQFDVEGKQTLPDEDKVRARLLRQIHDRVQPGRNRRRIIASLWLPLAAAIAIFVIAIFFGDLTELPPQVTTPQARLIEDSTGLDDRIVKVLPDGSTAHLNKRTKISYPAIFGSVREVSVHGEAFFQVVKNGKPFVVRSGAVKTQVLGTSFNVKHRQASTAEITLVEGKVRVVSPKGDSLELQAGEQALVDSGSGIMTRRNVNVLRYTGWKDNILFFEQTTFEQAIREIEEWYAVDIDIASPALKGCTITAKYQNEPLGNVLSSLEFLLGLNIKRLDDTHFAVDGSGCK